MKLAPSSSISQIDSYCQNELGIPLKELMECSGRAVANAVRSYDLKSKNIVILAGKGNNGADAYAAAVSLTADYDITVIDVFGVGQKSEEGRSFLEKFLSLGGEIIKYEPTEKIKNIIKNAGLIIDAVFGTGFHGEVPEELRPLAIAVRETVEAIKIAVDVPLGINADNGSVSNFAIAVDSTVELSFIKPGIVSYPARSYVGRIIFDDIGLSKTNVLEKFDFNYNLVDKNWISETLPEREQNSNKGTFGKLLMITGSRRYRGAAHLSLESALRGGVGLVTFFGREELCNELSVKFPEAIYESRNNDEVYSGDKRDVIHALSNKHTAVLIGSGSGNTDTLRDITLALLSMEGSPLILDADAINALSTLGTDGVDVIKNAKRQVILTPHPLEFARLTGNDVASVQLHRLEAAVKFAKENSCILVLKGAGTITTDGDDVYINGTGSSALSKAGSGDVLAGLIAATVAQRNLPAVKATALAVYYHALAGDRLAVEFSSYGVTPSDLPREIARCMAETERERSSKNKILK